MSFIYKIIFIVFLTSSYISGQSLFESIRYKAENGIYLSTSGNTPIWLRFNQYGEVPLENPIFTLKGSASKEYDSTYSNENKLNKFSFGYGVNAVVNVGKTNQVLLSEGYFKTRFGVFELYVGRRKEIVGLVDTTLTSGSYIWSGNALPLPKIQITIPNYTPILGKGLLSIKGAYGHGWFDNGSIRNFYLHQKHLYARIGKPNWKIKIYSGFSHQAQWGINMPYIDKNTGVLISKLPSDFRAYLKVIGGVSLNKNGNSLSTATPQNEALNRVGNHLGTIDFATEIILRNFDLFLYRQNIYEDGSLFYLNNIEDGLIGISIKRKNVNKGIVKICFEYLYTKNQGGRPEDRFDDIPQLRGDDNYFNNGLYNDGWTYRGNTIGTPLLLPINSVDKKQFYNKDLEKYSSYYILNRVEAFSFAIYGKGKNIDYYTKLILNYNLGTYQLPINAKQFSFLYRVNYKLPKFSVISSIAFDGGKLFSSSLGGYLGIQRTFF